MNKLLEHATLSLAAIAATYVTLERPWLRWGATPRERHCALPGDDVVPHAMVEATRAVTIDAPPDSVWPWLVQMGYGRAGWYSLDRWDNGGQPSADHIVPELQDLKVGDVIADATGPFGFRVVELVPGRALVFHATIHPVTGKRVDLRRQADASYLDFSWAFVIESLDAGCSRLLVRVRYNHTPRRWVALAVEAYEVIDTVFARRMLAGIKERAERERPLALVTAAA